MTCTEHYLPEVARGRGTGGASERSPFLCVLRLLRLTWFTGGCDVARLGTRRSVDGDSVSLH